MAEHVHHDKHDAHRRLVDRLRRQAEDVKRLASGLDEEAAARQTVPGKWSVKELVCHLHRVQDVFDARMEAMLVEDNPSLAPYEPEGDAVFTRMSARSVADSVRDFLAARERLTQRLDALTP